jgi:hypothetical protein
MGRASIVHGCRKSAVKQDKEGLQTQVQKKAKINEVFG